MALTAYPTATRLQSFIEAGGITLTSAQLANLPLAVDAAKADFEKAVGGNMLASATASARTFSPPTNAQGILYIDWLAANPTSVSYQPEDSTAEALVITTDYYVEPPNALAKGLPISRLRFKRRWTAPLGDTLRNSLTITGKWGYGSSTVGIPADAYQAMLARGAWLLWEQITREETGGRESVKEDDVAETFGVQAQTNARDHWGNIYDAAVRKYRRLTL
jgi:hypothetical protein